MNDVMIDLETLGLSVDSVIIQIAAVRFDRHTGDIGDYLHMSLSWSSQQSRKVDMSTIEWWMNQDKNASKDLLSGTIKLSTALKELSSFIEEDDRVWGNGSSFDISMLNHAFGEEETPWKYWNVRDVRTVMDLAKVDVRDIPFKGQPHNAKDDCLHQINYLSKAIKGILPHG